MPVIAHHPFFDRCFVLAVRTDAPEKSARELLNVALKDMVHNEEEDLFRTGDRATAMMFVALGEIKYKSRLDMEKDVMLTNDDWLCEQVLWLKWLHVGRAVAMRSCSLFLLEAHRFQEIFRNDRAAKCYSRHFLRILSNSTTPLTDAWGASSQSRVQVQNITAQAYQDYPASFAGRTPMWTFFGRSSSLQSFVTNAAFRYSGPLD